MSTTIASNAGATYGPNSTHMRSLTIEGVGDVRINSSHRAQFVMSSSPLLATESYSVRTHVKGFYFGEKGALMAYLCCGQNLHIQLHKHDSKEARPRADSHI